MLFGGRVVLEMVNFLNQQQAGDIPQNSAEVWDNILNNFLILLMMFSFI